MTTFLPVNTKRRLISVSMAAALALATLGMSIGDASAGYRVRVGGFHRGFHGDFRRGGFGGFRGGGFGGALGGAGLALGILGAFAATAEAAQEAQPQCYIANQPVLLSNGTYYYRKIRVCQ